MAEANFPERMKQAIIVKGERASMVMVWHVKYSYNVS